MPIIPAGRRLNKEGRHELEASLCHMARPCPKTQKQKEANFKCNNRRLSGRNKFPENVKSIAKEDKGQLQRTGPGIESNCRPTVTECEGPDCLLLPLQN